MVGEVHLIDALRKGTHEPADGQVAALEQQVDDALIWHRGASQLGYIEGPQVTVR